MNDKLRACPKRLLHSGALILVLAVTLFIIITASADAGTSFTYQGQLLDAGGVVNDRCDIQFSLYDAATGGSQIGSTVTRANVDVADGLFSVELDFGAGAFSGDPRWLKLAVRCPAGSGGYDTLAPRQPLSPTPYAMFAGRAMTADVASDVDAGAITPAHLNGLAGNGSSGQLLASDGSGGFGWQAGASGPVKQLVQGFVMANGESVSAGDVVSFLNGKAYAARIPWGAESVFHAADTEWTAACALSDTDFVVTYRDNATMHGKAITGTVSGGTLSWGTASTFHSAGTYRTAVTALSATDFVVAYQDKDNSRYGTAITGTISGGTLGWGTESAFNEGRTDWPVLSALSATDFVVAYRDDDNSGHGMVITGTVSGGTLGWGTESEFNPASTDYVALSTLSATDFVVAYRDQGNSSYGTVITGTVSGGTLSCGPESVFNAAATVSIAAAALSTTDFVVAYSDEGNCYHGMAIVGAIDEGGLTWGDESVFQRDPAGVFAVGALSSSEFVVAYALGNPDRALAVRGTSSGQSLSWGDASVFNYGVTWDAAIAPLTASEYVLSYADLGNSQYGTAIAGTLAGRTSIGTAKTAASGGETVTVILSGVSDVHSGLVPGEMYYLQTDGSLGLTQTATRVGLAISETELILDQLW